MKKIVVSMAIVLAFAITSCKTDKKEVTTETKKEIASDKYQCPMDCENGKTYVEAGTCPDCKMDLKPVKEKKDDHSDHGHTH